MNTAIVEAQHGPDCTCPIATRIDLTLVARRPDCRGERSPYSASRTSAQLDAAEPLTYLGRIAITWPASTFPGVLMPSSMQIHDYDSGEPITTITGIHIAIGGDNWHSEPIRADLTMLVDDEGQPLGTGRPAVADEYGKPRFATFRAYVAEMRVAEAEPHAVVPKD